MKRIATAALIAAAATAASWAVKRWLDGRYSPLPHAAPRALQTWEDEGGALAPHQVAIETSQVPR